MKLFESVPRTTAFLCALTALGNFVACALYLAAHAPPTAALFALGGLVWSVASVWNWRRA